MQRITRLWLKRPYDIASARSLRRAVSSASDVLARKQLSASLFAIREDSCLEAAVAQLVEQRLGSLVVTNDAGRVAGLVTARDILRALNGQLRLGTGHETLAETARSEDLNLRDVMTPAAKMVYCSPDDSLTDCTLIMSETKVRNLPVLKDGQLSGVITLKDIADVINERMVGGKKQAVKRVLPRRGISGAAVAEMARLVGDESEGVMALRAGAAELPRPTRKGLEEGKSEDAHFLSTVRWVTEEVTGDVTYMGVSDGVGSWADRGVDASLFSSRLMMYARKALEAQAARASEPGTVPPVPFELLVAAWKGVVEEEKVIGSATALIAALDPRFGQFAAANVGDCGFLVLRRPTLSTMGSMATAEVAAREGDERLVVFRSTQQLRGFNFPYQFGYVPQDDYEGSEKRDDSSGPLFEDPGSADLFRVPVEEGDIIVCATDGLFDNVDEDEIVSIVRKWEETQGAKPPSDSCMAELAASLTHRARELSLDRSRDSPFALLAKDNDILWSGGMPDDCTVIAAKVVMDPAVPPPAT
jgi:protein phosphatase PTC7